MNLIVAGLHIELQRKRVKHLNIRVYPATADIRVTAPIALSQAQIHSFVLTKLPWIKKHLNKRLLNNTKTVQEQRYQTGSEILFRGTSYLLEVFAARRELPHGTIKLDVNSHHEEALPSVDHITNRKSQVLTTKQKIFLFIKPNSTFATRQRLIKQWLRVKLMENIQQIVAHYQPLMAVEVKEIRTKKMRTRWGTCNIQAQRIWLNFELVKKDPILLEYVVVHEMVHLLEASHNHRFKALMTRFLPRWEEYQQRLNQL